MNSNNYLPQFTSYKGRMRFADILLSTDCFDYRDYIATPRESDSYIFHTHRIRIFQHISKCIVFIYISGVWRYIDESTYRHRITGRAEISGYRRATRC